MKLFYNVIYLLLDPEIYGRYFKSINLNIVKINHLTIWKIFIALNELMLTNKRQATVDDLAVVFKTLYPNESEKEMEVHFRNIQEMGSHASKDLMLKYLDSLEQRRLAFELSTAGIQLYDGAITPEKFAETLELTREYFTKGNVSQETPFVTDDLEALYAGAVREQGLRWRLDSLNKRLGSLRLGDFGFITARPETGKTTFLADQGSYMAECLDDDQGPVLWINNEEQGNKVMLRCIQATLGKTVRELSLDIKHYTEEYKRIIRGKLKLYDDANSSKSTIERLIAETKPSLLIVDNLDEVEGFKNDRKDLELGDIYKWARNIAKKQCPVIGISQADGTGEGVKALTMQHVANAKTSKQGEADFILGIGKSHNRDEQYIRYFNISKNKLMGDEDSDPNLRHDFWEVEIQPQIARYKDFNYEDDYYRNRPS